MEAANSKVLDVGETENSWFLFQKEVIWGLSGYEGFLGFFTSWCEYSVFRYYTASMIV